MEEADRGSEIWSFAPVRLVLCPPFPGAHLSPSRGRRRTQLDPSGQLARVRALSATHHVDQLCRLQCAAGVLLDYPRGEAAREEEADGGGAHLPQIEPQVTDLAEGEGESRRREDAAKERSGGALLYTPKQKQRA